MSVVSPTKASNNRGSARPRTLIGLAGLLAVLAIGAMQGGVAMVADPNQPLGMPASYLEGTPIDDYFWPGLFLLGIAVASVLTVVGLITGWEWRWASGIEKAIGHRWPWSAALAIGAVLLVFEIIELFVVPFHPVMHPLLIAGSIAIVWLALTPSLRAHLAIQE